MSSSSSPCAACKLLRRKCTQGCVFAPYFPPDQPARFANVHKVFGASNVSKLLNDLPQAQREDAVNSLAYEAEARLRDPVYGCVAYISILQHRIKMVREEIVSTRKELAGYVGQAAYAPFLPAQQPHHAAQFVPGMGLLQHPQQHQQQLMAAMHQQQQQQQQQQGPYHHQQIVDAQHMAAAVEVAARGNQDMIMHHGFMPAAGGPTVAVVAPEAAAYEGGAQPFLIQQQQQQPHPSAMTSYRMEPSPPPQSSGHSHVDMPHHRQQHTDGSDDGSGGPPPPT
ncbi:LOB domain-containing protein 36 [Brachypodium distachyon]|uniref:LOB domain-containing protein n=1 Tax=Brachypodium distachyon TaxID=15368 RepID=I1GQB0_BRADI|nr:LOB domain-containing protein 36 [Brachypodium distachyon]KQK14195.1 hypothetical protein BRADI_1g14677v3 [Brachypodium distachyon]KQK14196.1 hypothetical protein BRADI_1g14677v3 [Brachypodium distachyon]KQK14197.1 hypothetical protein BRADI_1g14677v3 [Brachypodium distachyon]KQK14198.1 hypothetical protein BRADI_1g14677v3 [Brachypodium distachyon]KQK14199.1 hypothetical protein BRADI_1g14677v3 [Brachypodium distachyon]|eukprot:XP_010232652.1 LOB domain-containing protein 36 [Brachypodium distachyon]